MKKKEVIVRRVLLISVFCICLTGALLLPVNQCPDEEGRLLLTEWMVRTGSLPTGNEAEVMIPDWGFSYALRPYLSAMIGAVFVRAVSFLTENSRVLLAAARMCSVLSVTVCCGFCLRLGKHVFDKTASALLYAVIVCFVPQVLFLGMYQNNDALSLAAVSAMVCYFAEGREAHWPLRSCLGLGISMSVALLSYYSAYGWILITALFCVVSVLRDTEISGKGKFLLGRILLIAGICVLLAGWFFARNAVIHGGDFLGLASEQTSRQAAREQGFFVYDYISRKSDGISPAGFLTENNFTWLKMTAMSMVGVFGRLNIMMPKSAYVLYYGFFLIGAVGFLLCSLSHRGERRNGLVFLLLLSGTCFTFVLHFWQSYSRDYQPSGRYIISALLLLGYMLTYGVDQLKAPVAGQHRPRYPAAVLAAVWLVMFVWVCFGTMMKML